VDGVKIVFANGSWLVMRPSGTEPAARIYAEAVVEFTEEMTLDQAVTAALPQVAALQKVGRILMGVEKEIPGSVIVNTNIPVVVIIGPSAIGKTRFINHLLQNNRLAYPRLTTTRGARHGVNADKDRIIVDEAAFKTLAASGKLSMVRQSHGDVEHADWYGLNLDELRRCLQAGAEAIILDTSTVSSLALIREAFPQVKVVLFMPRSLEEMAQLSDEELKNIMKVRLESRGGMTAAEMEKRLNEGIALLRAAQNGAFSYDLAISNGLLENLESNKLLLEEFVLAFIEAQPDHEINNRVGGDPARPVPGLPMPAKAAVNAEVNRIGWDNAQAIGIDAPEVILAAAYLRGIARNDMAEYLEYLADAGLIRAGPFSGFLAAVYQENIALSTNYPEYNTTLERAASLVHEIGATARFNFSHAENETREKDFNKEGRYLKLNVPVNGTGSPAECFALTFQSNGNSGYNVSGVADDQETTSQIKILILQERLSRIQFILANHLPPAIRKYPLTDLYTEEWARMIPEFKVMITSDIDLTGGNLGCADIASRIIILHTDFFNRSRRQQLLSLFQLVVSYLTRNIASEENAKRDMAAFMVLMAWAVIDAELKEADPAVAEKAGEFVFSSRLYHALARTIWTKGGIIDQIYQGKIKPFVKLDTMAHSEQSDDVYLSEADRQIKVGFLPIAGNPLTWGHILISFIQMLSEGYDCVIIRVQGEIGYKAVSFRDSAPVDLRHESVRQVVEDFYPLIRYTDLGVDNDLEGAYEKYNLLKLKDNINRGIHIFHILGVETVERAKRYIRMTHETFVTYGAGLNPDQTTTLAFNDRGRKTTIEELREWEQEIRTGEFPGAKPISITLVSDPDVDLEVSSTTYRMTHDRALIPKKVDLHAKKHLLYNHPPEGIDPMEHVRRQLQPVIDEMARSIAPIAATGKKMIMVSIDGGSGTGKSTIAQMLEQAAEQLPEFAGYNYMILGLDYFLRNMQWRQVIQKIIAGKPVTAEELAIEDRGESVDDFVKRCGITAKGKWVGEAEVFAQKEIYTFLQGIVAFAESDNKVGTFNIANAYVREEQTHRTITTMFVKPILVIVDGKFANLEELLPYYDMTFHLRDHSDRAMSKFEQRTRKYRAESAHISMAFYHLALVPSFEAYAQRIAQKVDYIIDLSQDVFELIPQIKKPSLRPGEVLQGEPVIIPGFMKEQVDFTDFAPSFKAKNISEINQPLRSILAAQKGVLVLLEWAKQQILRIITACQHPEVALKHGLQYAARDIVIRQEVTRIVPQGKLAIYSGAGGNAQFILNVIPQSVETIVLVDKVSLNPQDNFDPSQDTAEKREYLSEILGCGAADRRFSRNNNFGIYKTLLWELWFTGRARNVVYEGLVHSSDGEPLYHLFVLEWHDGSGYRKIRLEYYDDIELRAVNKNFGGEWGVPGPGYKKWPVALRARFHEAAYHFEKQVVWENYDSESGQLESIALPYEAVQLLPEGALIITDNPEEYRKLNGQHQWYGGELVDEKNAGQAKEWDFAFFVRKADSTYRSSGTLQCSLVPLAVIGALAEFGPGIVAWIMGLNADTFCCLSIVILTLAVVLIIVGIRMYRAIRDFKYKTEPWKSVEAKISLAIGKDIISNSDLHKLTEVAVEYAKEGYDFEVAYREPYTSEGVGRWVQANTDANGNPQGEDCWEPTLQGNFYYIIKTTKARNTSRPSSTLQCSIVPLLAIGALAEFGPGIVAWIIANPWLAVGVGLGAIVIGILIYTAIRLKAEFLMAIGPAILLLAALYIFIQTGESICLVPFIAIIAIFVYVTTRNYRIKKAQEELTRKIAKHGEENLLVELEQKARIVTSDAQLLSRHYLQELIKEVIAIKEKGLDYGIRYVPPVFEYEPSRTIYHRDSNGGTAWEEEVGGGDVMKVGSALEVFVFSSSQGSKSSATPLFFMAPLTFIGALSQPAGALSGHNGGILDWFMANQCIGVVLLIGFIIGASLGLSMYRGYLEQLREEKEGRSGVSDEEEAEHRMVQAIEHFAGSGNPMLNEAMFREALAGETEAAGSQDTVSADTTMEKAGYLLKAKAIISSGDDSIDAGVALEQLLKGSHVFLAAAERAGFSAAATSASGLVRYLLQVTALRYAADPHLTYSWKEGAEVKTRTRLEHIELMAAQVDAILTERRYGLVPQDPRFAELARITAALHDYGMLVQRSNRDLDHRIIGSRLAEDFLRAVGYQNEASLKIITFVIAHHSDLRDIFLSRRLEPGQLTAAVAQNFADYATQNTVLRLLAVISLADISAAGNVALTSDLAEQIVDFALSARPARSSSGALQCSLAPLVVMAGLAAFVQAVIAWIAAHLALVAIAGPLAIGAGILIYSNRNLFFAAKEKAFTTINNTLNLIASTLWNHKAKIAVALIIATVIALAGTHPALASAAINPAQENNSGALSAGVIALIVYFIFEVLPLGLAILFKADSIIKFIIGKLSYNGVRELSNKIVLTILSLVLYKSQDRKVIAAAVTNYFIIPAIEAVLFAAGLYALLATGFGATFNAVNFFLFVLLGFVWGEIRAALAAKGAPSATIVPVVGGFISRLFNINLFIYVGIFELLGIGGVTASTTAPIAGILNAPIIALAHAIAITSNFIINLPRDAFGVGVMVYFAIEVGLPLLLKALKAGDFASFLTYDTVQKIINSVTPEKQKGLVKYLILPLADAIFAATGFYAFLYAYNYTGFATFDLGTFLVMLMFGYAVSLAKGYLAKGIALIPKAGELLSKVINVNLLIYMGIFEFVALSTSGATVITQAIASFLGQFFVSTTLIIAVGLVISMMLGNFLYQNVTLSDGRPESRSESIRNGTILGALLFVGHLAMATLFALISSSGLSVVSVTHATYWLLIIEGLASVIVGAFKKDQRAGFIGLGVLTILSSVLMEFISNILGGQAILEALILALQSAGSFLGIIAIIALTIAGCYGGYKLLQLLPAPEAKPVEHKVNLTLATILFFALVGIIIFGIIAATSGNAPAPAAPVVTPVGFNGGMLKSAAFSFGGIAFLFGNPIKLNDIKERVFSVVRSIFSVARTVVSFIVAISIIPGLAYLAILVLKGTSGLLCFVLPIVAVLIFAFISLAKSSPASGYSTGTGLTRRHFLFISLVVIAGIFLVSCGVSPTATTQILQDYLIPGIDQVDSNDSIEGYVKEKLWSNPAGIRALVDSCYSLRVPYTLAVTVLATEIFAMRGGARRQAEDIWSSVHTYDTFSTGIAQIQVINVVRLFPRLYELAMRPGAPAYLQEAIAPYTGLYNTIGDRDENKALKHFEEIKSLLQNDTLCIYLMVLYIQESLQLLYQADPANFRDPAQFDALTLPTATEAGAVGAYYVEGAPFALNPESDVWRQLYKDRAAPNYSIYKLNVRLSYSQPTWVPIINYLQGLSMDSYSERFNEVMKGDMEVWRAEHAYPYDEGLFGLVLTNEADIEAQSYAPQYALMAAMFAHSSIYGFNNPQYPVNWQAQAPTATPQLLNTPAQSAPSVGTLPEGFSSDTKGIYYVVQSNDTVSDIALLVCQNMSYISSDAAAGDINAVSNTIASLNNLVNYTIYPGQHIYVSLAQPYPATNPATNDPDRAPKARELSRIIAAFGGRDALAVKNITLNRTNVVISPALASPAEVKGGVLYVNPNTLRGPPEQLRIIFEGHELFHLLGQNEEQARASTINYLITHNLLTIHINFLENNAIGLVVDEDWILTLRSASEKLEEARLVQDLNVLTLLETLGFSIDCFTKSYDHLLNNTRYLQDKLENISTLEQEFGIAIPRRGYVLVYAPETLRERIEEIAASVLEINAPVVNVTRSVLRNAGKINQEEISIAVPVTVAGVSVTAPVVQPQNRNQRLDVFSRSSRWLFNECAHNPDGTLNWWGRLIGAKRIELAPVPVLVEGDLAAAESIALEEPVIEQIVDQIVDEEAAIKAKLSGFSIDWAVVRNLAVAVLFAVVTNVAADAFGQLTAGAGYAYNYNQTVYLAFFGILNGAVAYFTFALIDFFFPKPAGGQDYSSPVLKFVPARFRGIVAAKLSDPRFNSLMRWVVTNGSGFAMVFAFGVLTSYFRINSVGGQNYTVQAQSIKVLGMMVVRILVAGVVANDVIANVLPLAWRAPVGFSKDGLLKLLDSWVLNGSTGMVLPVIAMAVAVPVLWFVKVRSWVLKGASNKQAAPRAHSFTFAPKLRAAKPRIGFLAAVVLVISVILISCQVLLWSLTKKIIYNISFPRALAVLLSKGFNLQEALIVWLFIINHEALHRANPKLSENEILGIQTGINNKKAATSITVVASAAMMELVNRLLNKKFLYFALKAILFAAFILALDAFTKYLGREFCPEQYRYVLNNLWAGMSLPGNIRLSGGLKESLVSRKWCITGACRLSVCLPC